MQSVRSTRPAFRFSPATLTATPATALMALVALLLTAGSFSACATGKPSGANRAGGIASFMIQPAGTELRIVSDAWIAGAGYEGETAMERRADFRRKTVYSASGTSAAVRIPPRISS